MGALAECNWSVFQGDAFDLHTALECLNTNLTTVIDSLAPLKVVRPTKGFDPWMDASLISLRRKRDAALRKFRRGRKEKHRKEFERLRDDFNARSALARDTNLHAGQQYKDRKSVV